MKNAPLDLKPSDVPTGVQIERLMAHGRDLRSQAIRTTAKRLTLWFSSIIFASTRDSRELLRQPRGLARRPLGPAGF